MNVRATTAATTYLLTYFTEEQVLADERDD